MIYVGIGLLLLIYGLRLLLGGTSNVYFGIGVFSNFGKYGTVFGVLFLVAGLVLIKAAMSSFKNMQ